MPEAELDSELLTDALVQAADDIRRAVHEALGTHPYKVSQIVRRWSGGRTGLGTPQDTVFVPDPQPTIKKTSAFRHGPGGYEKRYDAVLTGLSLRYSERELWPKGGGDTEVVWVVEEALGNAQDAEFYTVSDLNARRGDTPGDDIDWRMELKTVQPLSPFDGTDA